MNIKAKITAYAFLGALGLLCVARSADAGEPTEQIRVAVNRGVDILNDAKRVNQPRSDTINRLRPVVYPLFDFEEMAKRSLGPHWRKLDPQRQKEFVALFTELLEKTYANSIDLYDGQKVVYTGESVDQDFAEVETKIISKKGQAFSVVYKLHRVDGKWKVYDVVAEGISVVNNYRSQFNRVIVNSSFDELMRRMKERAFTEPPAVKM
ncbi:MAG TPA: ABC transporter substrate-binding protein [Candidatus Binatia bacterium]|jgi:phospholipid transport system substrate-binding protein